jgi:type II secretory pathway component PulM
MQITRREKLLAVALGIFVSVWSLFAFAVNPARDRIETLNRLIPEKQNELRKLQAKSSEYIFLQDSISRLRTKIADQQDSFQLLPFLETLIRQSGLEKKVVSMKQQVMLLDKQYSQTIVEVRLQNLTLSQLIDLLRKVESSDVLAKTKMLSIKRNAIDTGLLDSAFEVYSAQLSHPEIARL